MSVFNEEYQLDSNEGIFTSLHRPRTIISSVVESGRNATSLLLLQGKSPAGVEALRRTFERLQVFGCAVQQ